MKQDLLLSDGLLCACRLGQGSGRLSVSPGPEQLTGGPEKLTRGPEQLTGGPEHLTAAPRVHRVVTKWVRSKGPVQVPCIISHSSISENGVPCSMKLIYRTSMDRLLLFMESSP